MNILVSVLMCCVSSYIGTYPIESQYAMDFVSDHQQKIMAITENLIPDDAILAMCIIAPELSQYNNITNSMETFALYTLYVQGKISNFSIGAFQMKPSFAASIENEVSKHAYLSKYKDLIIRENNNRQLRYKRVERLTSLIWQLKYLSAFIEIVKTRTVGIFLKILKRNSDIGLHYIMQE